MIPGLLGGGGLVGIGWLDDDGSFNWDSVNVLVLKLVVDVVGAFGGLSSGGNQVLGGSVMEDEGGESSLNVGARGSLNIELKNVINRLFPSELALDIVDPWLPLSVTDISTVLRDVTGTW